MERKRELTSVDLAALVSELRDFIEAKVDKVYLYGEDLLRIRMRHFDYGRVELFIEAGDDKRVNTTDPDAVPDAPTRPPNFAKMLRNRISGATLTDISQFEFDRILTFSFERGDQRCRIIAELFGQGNVIVLDETDTIVDSLDTVRLRSRTVAPGATYSYPESQVNPFSLSRDRFIQQLRSSDADLVRTLATQVNLGGTYAEEVCTRAGIEKNVAVNSLTDEETERLHESLMEIHQQITDRQFDPRIYYDDDHPISVTPFELIEYEAYEFDRFDQFSMAVDTYYRKASEAEKEETTTPAIDEEIAKQQRIIEQQSGAIEQFSEQADEERAKAEALYANYDLVDEIIATVNNALQDGHSWDAIQKIIDTGQDDGVAAATAITNIDPSTETVTISLDDLNVPVTVTESVERNADLLYQEAKRIETKREGALEAIERSKAELAELEEQESEPMEPASSETTSEPADWVNRSSVPVRRSDAWYERFRWFETSDGYLVIGGRNADQNEELVKKYLDPHDRFFHTQAHGAPVTILKASRPSESVGAVDFSDQTLQETAQFAVSYSSVWKAGQYAGDVYAVNADQVGKHPESGEYLTKGEFVIRGDREYFDTTEVGVAIGIAVEPYTRVIGGPPSPIRSQAAHAITIEPGNIAQSDIAKRLYRQFREEFADTSFVRRVASPDRIQEFLPPGKSRIRDT